ncbi:hypothetical protein PSY30_23495, partial [Shigella flexneri]|nr:hypothetical protein [Shigella flexneri]
MSLQGSQMETDDPTTSYMLQVWYSPLNLMNFNVCICPHIQVVTKGFLYLGMGQTLQVFGTGFPSVH